MLPIFGKNVLRPGGESITNQQLCTYADSLSLIWTDFPTGEVEPILREDRGISLPAKGAEDGPALEKEEKEQPS